MRIAVLMATYNGERFIKEQIDSIILGKPAHAEMTLFISDDNSTDNTLNIIKNIKTPQKVSTVIGSNKLENKGYVSNFNNACSMAKADVFDCYFFADQDDIWHSNKLSTMYHEVLRISEQKHNTPVLVHSDLRVVDNKGDLIADSFIRYQHIPPPAKQSHLHFLHQNVATGCTFAFNEQLFNMAYPIPGSALVHDWWFALVAKFCGHIHFIEQPLIDYRQHSNNAIGATSGKKLKGIFNPKFLRMLANYPYHLQCSIQQAKDIHKIAIESQNFRGDLACQDYIEIEQLHLRKRITRCLQILGKNKNLKEKLFITLVATVISLPWFKKIPN